VGIVFLFYCVKGDIPQYIEPECKKGMRRCVDDGYQVCEEANGGFKWSKVTPCAPGETCSFGKCSGGECKNECNFKARECIGNGYRECGQFDSDSCHEWGKPVACPKGETCSFGECSKKCLDECGEGTSQCSGNGYQVCGNHDEDKCLEWGDVTPCKEGELCSLGKCSSEPCTNECAKGSRTCEGNGYKECGDYDPDECFEWSSVTPCTGGAICSKGECTTTCDNECAKGKTECAGNGYRTCGNYDDDKCLEWGPIKSCSEDETCSLGECSKGCTSECAAGSKMCEGNGYKECGNFDEDSCLEWSEVILCEQGETCSQGECSKVCSHECIEKTKQCAGTGYQVCGNYDEDECLEWGPIQDCAENETCSLGECSEKCTNECVSGTKQCVGDGYQTCGNYDKDECFEWSETTSCEEGMTCSFGECKKTCESECVSGTKQCAGNGYQECGNFDEDSCLEWGPINSCQEGQTCSSGKCSDLCSHECDQEGIRECEGNGFKECGNFDSDPCREWSPVTSCGQDQTCKNGNCDLPSNDKCEDAIEITQSGTWYGNTSNYTDDRQPWCTFHVRGKDAYFRLKLKKKANITLDLTGTKFNATLSLSTKCGRDYKETCKQHNPSGTPAIIRKDNFGPTEDYYVIVDGKRKKDKGEYTLTVTIEYLD
jgi:hypothetical protein